MFHCLLHVHGAIRRMGREGKDMQWPASGLYCTSDNKRESIGVWCDQGLVYDICPPANSAAVDGEGGGLNRNTEEMERKQYYWAGNPVDSFFPFDYVTRATYFLSTYRMICLPNPLYFTYPYR